MRNYGWPCYEGAGRQPGYDALDVTTCESLYAAGSATPPAFTYNHAANVVDGDGCAPGDSSISAVSFYTGTAFPAKYRGGLFFGDYARDCIWFMPLGADGQPDPGQRRLFAGGAPGPVFLTEGPDDALYYADLGGNTVRRISYRSPSASIATSPDAQEPPLDVHFDGRGSSDPEGGALTYAWDLDGDGAYDDSTLATPTWTYTTRGYVDVRLRVTNPAGLSGTATKTITVGVPPTVTIGAPTTRRRRGRWATRSRSRARASAGPRSRGRRSCATAHGSTPTSATRTRWRRSPDRPAPSPRPITSTRPISS